LVFRDKDEILIQSRDEKPLNRYFPELIEPLKLSLPVRCVLDGEIVIVQDSGLDFDSLQLRLHPAASRVKLLSQQIPASIVFFDLLCAGDRDLREETFQSRRRELESLLRSAAPPIHLTPATSEFKIASDWFRRFEGAGFDGVMAKPVEGHYEPDKRAMLKIKHQRDCDCVVAGFRWHKKGDRDAVGSLLLGLFDDSGVLHHVGVCASFTTEKRKELVEFLAPHRKDALAGHPWKEWASFASEGGPGHRIPGAQSRWSQGKDLSWEPLRPELVVEVAYDHMQGSRFRHTAQFRKWRSDKQPSDCTYAQLEVVPPQELSAIFSTGR
jgi:ATP-dependent DNA ligase